MDEDSSEKPNIRTPPSSDSEDDLRDFVVKGSDDDEKWDCQSILSTYSNVYNRPKLISERNSVRLPFLSDLKFLCSYRSPFLKFDFSDLILEPRKNPHIKENWYAIGCI